MWSIRWRALRYHFFRPFRIACGGVGALAQYASSSHHKGAGSGCVGFVSSDLVSCPELLSLHIARDLPVGAGEVAEDSWCKDAVFGVGVWEEGERRRGG